jgi:2,3-bisphosphoglycerate-independent phosphoglycerate mutase
MHSLMVLIDGWGDDCQPVAAGENAVVADLPNLKKILAWGRLHYFSICEGTTAPAFNRAVVPGSLSCILRLLGIPDAKQPRSRSYLELLASGGKMRPDQLVLRCNLVTKDAKGWLAAFNSVLPLPETQKLFQKIRRTFQAVEFWPQQGYKNLLLVPYNPSLLDLPIAPPHESLGRPVQELLAGLRQAAPALGDFLDGTEKLFKPYNPPGYSYGLYPWGVSPQSYLASV